MAFSEYQGAYVSTLEMSGGESDPAASYLIEVDGQEREREAVRRFCATPFMFDELLIALGVPGEFHWVILEVPHGRLMQDRIGDIDILAGPLAWNDPAAIGTLITKNRETHPTAPGYVHAYCAAVELAGHGGLMWPPPMDHLVAIEAKCAYFHRDEQKVKSQKTSPSNTRNVQMQIEELLGVLPFNRVALLDFIVHPPAAGIDGQGWLNASDTAVHSLEQMCPTLQGRLPSDSPAGHFVMSWVSIEGGTEAFRGAGAPIELRSAIENPRLASTAIRERRERMAERLKGLLAEYSQPLSFPVRLRTAAGHKE